ncbi:hypothetical protein [Streptomyces sp. NPDC001530]
MTSTASASPMSVDGFVTARGHAVGLGLDGAAYVPYRPAELTVGR